MDLRNKTALVTGGAVRIGRAICEALAEARCNVVIHCRRSEKAAQSLARALKRRGIGVGIVQGDLADEAACRAAIGAARRCAGRLHILVNNAAVFHKDPLRTVTGAKLQAEMAVNLFAPLFLTREFAAQAGRGGKVVNLLDRRIAGYEVGSLPYLLSKKALAEFTRAAALELAPRISVNAVAPGAVLPPPGRGPDRLREWAGPNPLRRKTTPQDIAQTVVYLLQADSVTGQVIYTDGGQHLLGSRGG